ncbi:MAG TPA: methionine--tRNA ligase [Phycisphaerae bacterium]|nr:methionine--tRNA ligase [Phycisphaerae bacterium]
MAAKRNILVTSALPYANGSIHIGHLVEYIQTDVWVRFQRLVGNTVTYVCGDDAHGTPIMLKAQEAGVKPEEWIERFHKEHQEDFARFGVKFDNYGSTHDPLNKELSYRIYERVKGAGLIETREIEQLFDPKANIFLPDRFVKGTCPHCKSPDQYGDSCEVCGKTFDPSELINPVSVVSGATPVLKKSEHLFLNLEKSRGFLEGLYEKGFVDEAVKNKLLDWFKEPLRSWDITRNAPFFGFEIPDQPGKYFYNWFDAPIGYIASLGAFLKEDAAGTEEFWNNDHLERFHFIGKDIQYFHALFWPVMLHAAGLASPTKLAVHGHLTVNGKKMSKRDGTFIKASTFAQHLEPQYLRYYYATKLGPAPEDLDLSFEDFSARINGELVNKLANLVSRCAPMLTRLLEGQIGVSAMDGIPLLREVRGAADEIAAAYDSRNFAAATRTICALADKANKYVEDQAPWKLVKTDLEWARGVLTAALEAGRILTIYLKPILPEFAAKVEKCLGLPEQTWENIQDAMEPHRINAFEHLVQRLDMKAVEAMVEESREKQEAGIKTQEGATQAASPANGAGQAAASPGAKPVAAGHADDEAMAGIISFEQFTAVDLRVAKVLTAEPLEKSDKLMKLTLDVGHLGQRTILAGIKKAYTPDRLVGRLVIFCANLAPRTMGKFGTSEGMICAAGPGGSEVFVLSPDSGAKAGQRVH